MLLRSQRRPLTWLRCGMALKTELGDAGFASWREWAMTSAKWDEDDGRRVWKSIEPEGGVTIATLFGLAQDHGWREARKPMATEGCTRPQPNAARANRRRLA